MSMQTSSAVTVVVLLGFKIPTTVKDLFSNPAHEATRLMKSRASEVRKTIKNCANEVPEGNSMTFASAMCNAGLKS